MKRRVQQPSDGTLICTRCGNQQEASDAKSSGFYRAKPGSMNDKTYGGFAMPCKECNRARCKARGFTASDSARQKKRWESDDKYRRASADLQRRRRSAMTTEELAAWNETRRVKYAALP